MLEVCELKVCYGALEAVRKVSFRVDTGEIVALVGSNGAGKSSTLKALMGLVPVAGGALLWEGRAIEKTSAAQRVAAGIALSPEGRRLFARMSVYENLLVGAHTVRSRRRRSEMLDMIFQIFPRVRERRAQLAGSLSGGEQQMVAIGRAMMAQPRVLMLDEPSLGIAPKVVAEIAAAILRVNKEAGMSVILVEQNARLALRLAHSAHAFEQGQIVRSGSGAELLVDPFVQRAYLGL
jgi:branched-chain amino acid transport system ATP-binding protein